MKTPGSSAKNGSRRVRRNEPKRPRSVGFHEEARGESTESDVFSVAVIIFETLRRIIWKMQCRK